MKCLSRFAIISLEKRAGCFSLIVFLVSLVCCWPVSLHHVMWVGLQCVIVLFPGNNYLLRSQFWRESVTIIQDVCNIVMDVIT